MLDAPNKAFQKLKIIFEGTDTFEKSASAIAHLRDVIEYTKRFDVTTKIYINPLSSLKEKFCKGGIIFSCLYDRKVRDVFAAGGRYDSLIRENRHKTGNHEDRHAVEIGEHTSELQSREYIAYAVFCLKKGGGGGRGVGSIKF